MSSIIAIPMYRVSPLEWEKEFEKELDKVYEGFEATEEQIEKYKQRKREKEEYHWKYNDVMGWIELSVEFNKVKGRLFIADRKRFTRWFHPKYKDNFKIAIEVTITNKDNEQITKEVKETLHEWKQVYYKNRFIDYTHLDFVDWKRAMK